MSDGRTLLLLRHAKAEPTDDRGDHARGLTARGRRDAVAVGQWLTDRGLVPDLALCSDAARAVQTWDGVAGSLPQPVAVRTDPRLYEASAPSLVALLAETPAEVRTLLVVGHEPTVSETAVALAGEGSDGALLAAVRAHLPTSGVVVLRLDGEWAELEAEACRLVARHPSHS